MAYQLKTTGLAQYATMWIGVDEDTNAIKDFADTAVTADITRGANVTNTSFSYDGATREAFKLGSGTTAADFVAFGTNKPQFTFNVNNTCRTIVFIGRVAGNSARVFGKDSSNYFASINTGSGGTTFPTIFHGSTNKTGGAAALSSGNIRVFGFTMKHGSGSGYTKAFYAADTDSAVTVSADLGAVTSTSASTVFALDYVGRRNDNTGHQQDDILAIAILEHDGVDFSDAELDTFIDYFNNFLEPAGGTSTTLSADAGTLTVNGQDLSFKLSAVAANGLVNFNGQDVTFTHEQPGVYVLSIDPAVITFSAPESYSAIGITLSPGVLSFNGQDTTLNLTEPTDYLVSIEPGIIYFQGKNVVLVTPGSLGEGDIYIKLALLGYTGTLNDMLLAYWKDNGATSSSFQDAQKEYLTAAGFTSGSLQDRWKLFYESLGYSGSLNDQEDQYWWNL